MSKGNPNLGEIIKNKSDEEKQEIYKKSSETRRKNCADRHRFMKIVDKAMREKIVTPQGVVKREHLFISTLIKDSCDRSSRSYSESVKTVLALSGFDAKKENQMNINIGANDIEIKIDGSLADLSK